MSEAEAKTPISVHLETHILQNDDVADFKYDMPGQMVRMGDSIYLRFDEDDNHDGQPVPVTVKINHNGEVKLTHSGENRMQMNFIEGKRVRFNYHTPFGVMPIHLFTQILNIQYQDKPFRGQIEIHYQLENNGEVVGKYRMELHFTA